MLIEINYADTYGTWSAILSKLQAEPVLLYSEDFWCTIRTLIAAPMRGPEVGQIQSTGWKAMTFVLATAHTLFRCEGGPYVPMHGRSAAGEDEMRECVRLYKAATEALGADSVAAAKRMHAVYRGEK